FAPFSRASLRPMAMACLRLLTFLPEPPLSVPCLRSCIAFFTFFCAVVRFLAAGFFRVEARFAVDLRAVDLRVDDLRVDDLRVERLRVPVLAGDALRVLPDFLRVLVLRAAMVMLLGEDRVTLGRTAAGVDRTSAAMPVGRRLPSRDDLQDRRRGRTR